MAGIVSLIDRSPVGRLRRSRLGVWAAVPKRRRILTLAALAVAIFTFDFFLAVRHGFFDLNVYHGAINYWLNDGGALYDFYLPTSTYGFTYPTLSLIHI